MSLKRVAFENADGQKLSGLLELPKNREAHNFVLFAHCFTCTKNLKAAANIAQALTDKGFAVLRFDFTGLGDSDGDFEDTNFSGNVADLLAACRFLSENYTAPTLLVGHSLGGTAALYAAAEVDSVKAVATIGAPADPEHVRKLLRSDLEEIEQQGEATVQLDGRSFTIKKQFLDDLDQKPLKDVLDPLEKALLILHAPQDQIVEIINAEKIFMAARHSKSFISLDRADHLLSENADSAYAGRVIAGWASRYVPVQSPKELISHREVAASLDADDGFTTALKMGEHYMTADEPVSFGGKNAGPSPYEFYAAALASCTAMTIQMYARRKKWNVQHVTVHVSHHQEHTADCGDCEEKPVGIYTLDREISLRGDLTRQQKDKLIQIAEKCPVHRTMLGKTEINTKLKDD